MSVLLGQSFISSPPQRPMASDFEGFLYQILSITLFYFLNSWERASISLFNVECQTRELRVPFYNVFGMTRPLTGDWTRDLPHPRLSRRRCSMHERVSLCMYLMHHWTIKHVNITGISHNAYDDKYILECETLTEYLSCQNCAECSPKRKIWSTYVYCPCRSSKAVYSPVIIDSSMY